MEVGNWTDFVGGFMDAEATKQDARDKIDLDYKLGLNKANAQMSIDKARIENESLGRIREKGAIGKSDATAQDLVKYFTNQSNGVISTNPAGNAGAVPTPGVPAEMQGNQPIQPRTMTMPEQPIQQAQAAPPMQGGMNSPQGGAVPLQGMQQAPMQEQLLPPPPEIPAESPAGQVIGQAKIMDASNMIQAGATPIDAYIASTDVSPATKEYMSSFANMYDIKDPRDLEALMRSKAEYNTAGKSIADWQTDVVNPWLAERARSNKSGPIDETQLGELDTTYLKAMKSEGITVPTKTPSISQQRSIESQVNAARITKAAATQGLNAMNSIFHLTGDLENGPMASIVGQVKATFGQMTDQQASDATTSLYWANKETINTTNAQLRSLPGGTRIGIGLGNLEKQGVPTADMPKEAMVKVALEYLNNYRRDIEYNTGLINAPSHIPMSDRIRFADKWEETNPVVLKDGHSPNPSFTGFNEWLMNTSQGIKSKGVNAETLRKQSNEQALSVNKDVEAGGTGKIDPNIEAIQNGLPAGAKVTRIK